ncbi:Glycoside hydrolase family 3 [Lasiodiplodia theobromae]|uniref:xylan 1,4-beta-xylosidase n=1 Tax=Lasiodiplodia theobromae TaxID=45133 RepID=A0A5N5DFY6_9PEZI|nr:Glycoside hydrolase family 3 [Lasiodiplodia theobromae]KAB2575874.1 putative exo-1,4-beta-xylosidase bxlB [Lasiodiplodia theobromae]KAF4546498.1 Glycoside hydrolase family 3 [Lasiodiplodia theobromae]KAF9631909.1 Glycoside hydrolase family 3 [Lasiodiplodia theobromae]
MSLRTSIAGVAALAAQALAVELTTFGFPDCANGPLKDNLVCDSSASPRDRAAALVNELTLEEKFNNTGNTSPGVPRLGIPAYQWWNEALHGVAFTLPGKPMTDSGNFSYATSFPQPILMGAAFDDQLIYDVASVISTEARAFSNGGRSGLDYWTPNINPYKDPRWGRGQETPGEDPFHLASYVQHLIHGLEGNQDDPYKKIVATCKHFTGYDLENWNGNFRYQFDAKISMQDMVEYYMPPFQACAREAKVGAFMCSYNAVNGVPTCADPWLLQTVLREHWGWDQEDQWVVSDCDAIQNVYLPHEWGATREEAVADSLKAGTDLNCGTYYQRYLPGAYDQGLINDTDINRALTRTFASLVKLGYFDAAEDQPYRQIGWSDVNTQHAQDLALKAAQEGIVLLKNDGLLPLSLDGVSSIALIGSWANATEQMQGNYYGIPPYLHSPLYAAQQLGVTVNYAEGASQGNPTTDDWGAEYEAAAKSDVIIVVGGIDNDVESEELDRVAIAWSGPQLDMITQLATYGKPVIVVQMGAGQLDSTPLVANANVSALLWAGYPGQDGGVALFDVITGAVAPAGRLPVTQYPARFTREVPMTDMALRPSDTSAGRTYKWYNGTAVFPFGFGLHYTNFSAEVTSGPDGKSFAIADLVSSCGTNSTAKLDLCPFTSLAVAVTNTGAVDSDYVALAFLTGSFGPLPRPKSSLVAYDRLHGIAAGTSQTAALNLTLGSLARVDENGDKVLYPGDYAVLIDVPDQPLASVNFTLTGDDAGTVIESWPRLPTEGREAAGVENVPADYYEGGYGSVQQEQEVL